MNLKVKTIWSSHAFTTGKTEHKNVLCTLSQLRERGHVKEGEDCFKKHASWEQGLNSATCSSGGLLAVRNF